MEMKDRIIQVMKIKSLNAAELADLMEIKRPSLSHIMTGRNNPSLDFITRLKETFPEISLDWLLFGKGAITISNEQRPASASVPKMVQPKLFDDRIENNETSTVLEQGLHDQKQTLEEKEKTFQQSIHHDESIFPIEGQKKEVPAPEEQRLRLSQGQKRPVKMLIIYDDDSFMQYTYQRD